MIAYHGTNKVFSSFDLNFLLSGEGSNSHGPGFYFALDPLASEKYAHTMSKRYIYNESNHSIDTARDPVFGAFVDNELEEYIIYTIQKVKDNKDYPYKEVIFDILKFNKSRLPFNLVLQRYEEVISTYTHKPPVLYTVDIDTSNKDKYVEYHGTVDGDCILVKDPSIIQIKNIQML